MLLNEPNMQLFNVSGSACFVITFHDDSVRNGRITWRCPYPLQVTWQILLGYIVPLARKDLWLDYNDSWPDSRRRTILRWLWVWIRFSLPKTCLPTYEARKVSLPYYLLVAGFEKMWILGFPMMSNPNSRVYDLNLSHRVNFLRRLVY